MAGKAAAVASGDGLVKEVAALGVQLGLQAREQFKCGRRVWGAERFIDVVLTEPGSRRRRQATQCASRYAGNCRRRED